MSEPNEAREPAEDAGANTVPAPSAPPSFGKAAGPMTGGSGTSDADTEPGSEAGSEAEAEPGSESGSEGIRLPIGLQRPWWASADEGSGEPATSGDGGDVGDGEGGGDEEEPEITPAGETEGEEPDAPKPPPPVTAPPVTVSPVTVSPVTVSESLVAGRGVPTVDTRGAVPAEPIVQPAGPVSPDTDPDGIAAVQPDDDLVQDEPVRDEPVQDGPKGTGGGENPAGGEVPVVVATPEAFHPRDTPPPEDPPGSPTVTTPLYQVEGGLPFDVRSPAAPERQDGPGTFGVGPLSVGAGAGTDAGTGPGAGKRLGGGDGRRRPLLIGGGLVAMIIIAIAGFVMAGAGSDSQSRTAKAAETQGAKTDPVPSPSASPPVSAPPAPGAPGPASKIDNERTDGRPLALSEAFPAPRVDLGGRAYSRDRASVNHRCALAARGGMADSLTRERCGSVVRVTFLDKERSLAVTSGIAVLPGKDAAVKVSKAGDPSKYEWFRAMPGSRTSDIDQAGGYAASTARGRYVAYAYATYANGKRPQPGDATLRGVAEQFVGYALRPIDARARG